MELYEEMTFLISKQITNPLSLKCELGDWESLLGRGPICTSRLPWADDP